MEPNPRGRRATARSTHHDRPTIPETTRRTRARESGSTSEPRNNPTVDITQRHCDQSRKRAPRHPGNHAQHAIPYTRPAGKPPFSRQLTTRVEVFPSRRSDHETNTTPRDNAPVPKRDLEQQRNTPDRSPNEHPDTETSPQRHTHHDQPQQPHRPRTQPRSRITSNDHTLPHDPRHIPDRHTPPRTTTENHFPPTVHARGGLRMRLDRCAPILIAVGTSPKERARPPHLKSGLANNRKTITGRGGPPGSPQTQPTA